LVYFLNYFFITFLHFNIFIIMFNNVLNFIKESPVENITTGSIIYKVMEINPTIAKEELYQLLINITDNIKNEVGETSERYTKLCNIPIEVIIKYFKNFFYAK
jgi:hypothetical protein